ncbi:MAG: aldehyde dehydrogenase family protein [Planctomycetota bacterium]|nr:aldehyde dehydrogenase family protein [Planctomycetota bacterium]
MKHASLRHDPSNLISGAWIPTPGNSLTTRNPARPAEVLWSAGVEPSHVHRAVAAAHDALPTWASWPREKRFDVLRRFQKIAAEHLDAATNLLRDEIGKPAWDAKGEAGLLGPKVDITLDESATGALRRVSGFETPVAEGRIGRCWFRPHGVMAVLGPFNFPMHLPNGHIVPALAMGNTIVFKPSDKAAASGQFLAELYHQALTEAGAPPGVVNLVQGGADVASALVRHDDLDGILFTGSWPVGRRILEANLDRPGRIAALEMGGNNPAIIMPDADLRQAAIECVRCAFITSGQRCTCTRRVLVHRSVAGRFITALAKAASNLLIGDPASPHPVFMGPVISHAARDQILAAQSALAKAGGEVVVPMTPHDPSTFGGSFLTPGVMRVPRFVPSDNPSAPGADIEVFGPFLRIAEFDDLDDAIAQANATRFGLAASIFTKSQTAADRFLALARAGCVNVNTGTAGASSKLPFGGLGLSGNHRPAGAFSLDYCAYPVAGMIESGAAALVSPGMRFEDAWLA